LASPGYKRYDLEQQTTNTHGVNVPHRLRWVAFDIGEGSAQSSIVSHRLRWMPFDIGEGSAQSSIVSHRLRWVAFDIGGRVSTIQHRFTSAQMSSICCWCKSSGS
jgi:hypothetical protein